MNVFDMKFSKVFPLLVAKAERKGRRAEEVYAVAAWLTGYGREELNRLLNSDITYGDFFDNAPQMNPDRKNVKGKSAVYASRRLKIRSCATCVYWINWSMRLQKESLWRRYSMSFEDIYSAVHILPCKS